MFNPYLMNYRDNTKGLIDIPMGLLCLKLFIIFKHPDFMG